MDLVSHSLLFCHISEIRYIFSEEGWCSFCFVLILVVIQYERQNSVADCENVLYYTNIIPPTVYYSFIEIEISIITNVTNETLTFALSDLLNITQNQIKIHKINSQQQTYYLKINGDVMDVMNDLTNNMLKM